VNLRLDLRLHLDGDGDQELVREVVVVEARKFTAALADALEETGVEVQVEPVDHVRGWRRLLRS
jgi:hypothetical protein